MDYNEFPVVIRRRLPKLEQIAEQRKKEKKGEREEEPALASLIVSHLCYIKKKSLPNKSLYLK